MENKNIIWYIVGAVVLVLLVALVMGMNPSTSPNTGDVQVNNTSSTNNTVTNPTPDTGTNNTAADTPQEVTAEEEERLSDIQSERETLLAEQAALDEALQNASTSELSPEELQRQNEIDLELLELQNQEEYPPLPDPGL